MSDWGFVKDLDPLKSIMKRRRLPALHKAAMLEDCSALLRLVQLGKTVNSLCYRNTALHYAAAFDRHTAVYLLLRLGADRELVGECGFTPLSMAVRAGADNSVKILLFWGAAVTRDTLLLRSSLHNCSPSTTVQLCQNGALDHVSQEEKNNILVKASLLGHVPLVSFLLLKGADPSAKVFQGGPSLLHSKQCSARVLQLLFQRLLETSEPLTPEQMKGLSVVQRRYMRRSRSF